MIDMNSKIINDLYKENENEEKKLYGNVNLFWKSKYNY